MAGMPTLCNMLRLELMIWTRWLKTTVRRGRQEALLRHLRARSERTGGAEFRSEALSSERQGDRLKQELINLAGKRLVSCTCQCCACLKLI